MPKEVRELLMENVPFERQDFPDFKFILTLISKNKFTTVEQLSGYLDREILASEGKLSGQKRANSTINRQRINVVKTLDGLRLCQRLIKDYLA